MAQATDYPHGYPKVAKLMAPHPNIAIFRRFGSLTMLNLMRLQAELLVVENDLRNLQISDQSSSNLDVQSYSSDFRKLNESKDPHNKQLLLMEQSLDKLEKYTAQITQLSKPSDKSLKFLRKWLIGENEGDSFQKDLELLRTWDEDVTRDLVALSGSNPDPSDVSRWFKPFVVAAYHWVWQGFRNVDDPETGNVYDYENSKFMRLSKWIVALVTTVAASLLPALVILWLVHVETTVTRVWITIGFTGAIGLLMKIVTNANMKEILAATIAFAAVEVVFIGSANGK